MVNSSDILNAKVLIVDDQEINISLLKLILGSAGYASVASTTNPREVCELHRKNRYDLILLDLLMPGMYGFQVIEGLKEIETDGELPVLVISAQPDYKMRAVQAGAKEFITRPINRSELLGHVHNMLEVRLSRKEARNDRNAMGQAVGERTAGLQESENLFQQIAASFPDALWIREVNGDLIRYVNPAWEKIIGQHLTAGDRADKVFAAIYPDDLQMVLRETGRMPNGGVDLECRIVRPDGAVRRVHVRTFPIMDSSGKIARIAGIMEDITGRKAEEKKETSPAIPTSRVREYL